mgnify:CR=1 FL=1
MASLSFVFQPCGRCVTTDGSFSPSVDKYELLMDLVQDAVAAGGFSLGTDLHIALNCAASEFYDQASTDTMYNKWGKSYILTAEESTSRCAIHGNVPPTFRSTLLFKYMTSWCIKHRLPDTTSYLQSEGVSRHETLQLL